MTYAYTRVFGLGMCLIATGSLLVASGKPAPQHYTFEDRDLNEDRFIAGLVDLTAENYAYCAWTIKKELRYWSIVDKNTGCFPLEIVLKNYSLVDEEKKERYKNIFELLLRAGASFAADAKNRMTDKECADAAQLGALFETFLNLRNKLPSAQQAVRDKDILALDAVLKDNPLLVKIVDITTRKTLLHDAAQYFDSKDAASVQMFAHLMRKGADYEMPDGNGQSVAMAMKKDSHQASTLFKNEKEALDKQAQPKFSVDRAKKAVEPVVNKLAPYKYQLGCITVAIALVWYLVASAQKTKMDSSAATFHVEQLA